MAGLAVGGDDTRAATELALAAIKRLVEPGMRVLDAGCGEGPLARAAAARGARVRAIDHDPDAIARAQAHGIFAELGEIQNVAGEYDLVVANLWADELLRVAPSLAARARKKLYVTGLRLFHRAAVEARFGALGLAVVRAEARAGWCGLTLTAVPSPQAGGPGSA